MKLLKRYWFPALLAVACVVLAFTAIRQNGELTRLRLQVDIIRDLQREDQNTIRQLEAEVAELEERVEESVEVISGYELRPVGIVPERKTLLADMVLTLRQWAADTSVVLHVFVGDERTDAFLTPEAGVCQGRIEVPLQSSEPLRMTASVTTGGVTTLENVGGGALSMFLPIRQSGGGWSGPWYQDGVMTCSEYHVSMEDRDYRGTEDVFEPEFRFYRNDEPVLTLPGTTAFEEAYGDAMGGRFWPDTANGGWSVPCEVGDTVTMFFRCRDKYGLGYEFYVAGWNVVEAARAADSVENAEYEGKELTLFWD